jgi:pimeloyl-ACP methyl ester carboxylesterase
MVFILKSLLTVTALTAILLFAAYLYTQIEASKIAARNPNVGEILDIGGLKINSVLVPAGHDADLPTLVFIHGASGNLRDPMGAFADPLKGRAEMLFVDRPGHGYSKRGGDENLTPEGQADAIARLMDKRGVARAIIIGHSFGGATTATFALRHPEKTLGLVFLSAATHPWPGGVDWYYDLANTPVLGTLFCNTLSLPAGLMMIDQGIEHVFRPNQVPAGYRQKAAIEMVLRPDNFCANARDVANLLSYVTQVSPRYHEINVPTVIIAGDSDDIVYESIHSVGLKRDIANSEYVRVKNLGHKPDYVATDLAIAAIEKVAGKPRDLQAVARIVEERIAP